MSSARALLLKILHAAVVLAAIAAVVIMTLAARGLIAPQKVPSEVPAGVWTPAP